MNRQNTSTFTPSSARRPGLLVAALLAGGALAACEPIQDDAAEFRAALPRAEDLDIDLPEEEDGTNEGGLTLDTVEQSAVGEVAEYYLVTRNTTRWLNAVTFFWASLLHQVALFPPSSVEADQATWGPWRGDGLDPLEYRMVVHRVGDGEYEYDLEARRKDNPEGQFISIISGTSLPGTEEVSPSGTMHFDFDARNSIDPTHNEAGLIDITYDLVDHPWTNDIIFTDFVGENGEGPTDATYHYEVTADGAGKFDFAATRDLEEGTGEPESFHIVSQWRADGVGRSDVAGWGGDFDETVIHVSECWDNLFLRTWYEATADGPADGDWLYDEGESATCGFGALDVEPLM